MKSVMEKLSDMGVGLYSLEKGKVIQMPSPERLELMKPPKFGEVKKLTLCRFLAFHYLNLVHLGYPPNNIFLLNYDGHRRVLAYIELVKHDYIKIEDVKYNHLKKEFSYKYRIATKDKDKKETDIISNEDE